MVVPDPMVRRRSVLVLDGFTSPVLRAEARLPVPDQGGFKPVISERL